MEVLNEWIPVVFADECAECSCCGEPLCWNCGDHYMDCPCPGPTQDEDYEYRVLFGQGMEARRLPDEETS